jgi:hypothetical protein
MLQIAKEEQLKTCIPSCFGPTEGCPLTAASYAAFAKLRSLIVPSSKDKIIHLKM